MRLYNLCMWVEAAVVVVGMYMSGDFNILSVFKALQGGVKAYMFSFV